MISTTNFKIFDAHLHTFGVFLEPNEDIISYMDKYNVEKAIITTINRTKYLNSQNDLSSKSGKMDELRDFMDNFKRRAPKGQLSHQDVIDIANKAPDRFYKFFWFNPNLKQEEKEKSYNTLKDHFKKGFCGVKIHSAFNFVKFPRDVIELISFMQDFDEKLILYIHSLPKTTFFGGVSTHDIAKLATQYPKLRIIVGHAAYSMEYAIDVGTTLKQYDNIFFETSCSVSFGIYNILKTLGHERILFGSDSPTASTLPIEIQKVLTLPRISEEMKQDILYNNINELLKIE